MAALPGWDLERRFRPVIQLCWIGHGRQFLELGVLAVLMVMLVVWLLSLAGVVWLVRVADAEARAPEDREASDI